MKIIRSVEGFLEDVRYGVRKLRLSPGFTAVAVLSLALGIGANAGIFQLINGLRLRSLSLPDAHELVAVDTADEFFASGWWSGRNTVFTWALFEQMTELQQAFSGLTAFGTDRFNLSRGGEARYAEAIYITPNFLNVLGVAPTLGGWLPAETDPRDCSEYGALLSYGFWQSEYGGDPSVLGDTISLDLQSVPILGVTPPSFTGLEPGHRFDIAVPVCATAIIERNRTPRMDNLTAWWLTPIGRLKPGWSVERASAHMVDISAAALRGAQPETYRPAAIERFLENELDAVSAHAGVSSVRRQYLDPLWILLASTGLVLLITCANLANLLLARASAREREMALRQAVGASRWRLLGQLMTESLVLSGLGAVFGAFVAYFLSRGLVLFLDNEEWQLELLLGVDWRVVGFTALLATGTCILFGLAPALRATRTAPADAMRGGRGATESGGRHRLRQALVVSQIAFSLVLLVGALLFGQSLRNLLTDEIGITSEGVVMARVDANLPHIEPEARMEVFRALEERIAALPDVESTSVVMFAPFSGSGWNQDVHPGTDGASEGGENTWFNRVGPGYFKTLKTPLLAGRDFDSRDHATAPRVAIINEKFAHDLFGKEHPIGRTFRYEATAGKEDPVFEVVGLVKNTRYGGLREEQRRIAFLPVAQDDRIPGQLSYVVRARGSFAGVMSGIKRRMAETDGGLLVEFSVLDVAVSESVLRERLMAHLSGGFGVLATLLAALGLYGVMSYTVVRRRNEIGIRMALGAERARIRKMIFADAGRLLTLGLALGLIATVAAARYAESFLYGLPSHDIKTLALGSLLLAVVAVVAALLPAHRATGLDPAVVLRDE